MSDIRTSVSLQGGFKYKTGAEVLWDLLFACYVNPFAGKNQNDFSNDVIEPVNVLSDIE